MTTRTTTAAAKSKENTVSSAKRTKIKDRIPNGHSMSNRCATTTGSKISWRDRRKQMRYGMCSRLGRHEGNASWCLLRCAMRQARVLFFLVLSPPCSLRFGSPGVDGAFDWGCSKSTRISWVGQGYSCLTSCSPTGVLRCLFFRKDWDHPEGYPEGLRRQCCSFLTSHRKLSASLQCAGRGRNPPKAPQGEGVDPAPESLRFHAHWFSPKISKQEQTIPLVAWTSSQYKSPTQQEISSTAIVISTGCQVADICVLRRQHSRPGSGVSPHYRAKFLIYCRFVRTSADDVHELTKDFLATDRDMKETKKWLSCVGRKTRRADAWRNAGHFFFSLFSTCFFFLSPPLFFTPFFSSLFFLLFFSLFFPPFFFLPFCFFFFCPCFFCPLFCFSFLFCFHPCFALPFFSFFLLVHVFNFLFLLVKSRHVVLKFQLSSFGKYFPWETNLWSSEGYHIRSVKCFFYFQLSFQFPFCLCLFSFALPSRVRGWFSFSVIVEPDHKETNEQGKENGRANQKEGEKEISTPSEGNLTREKKWWG